jgi:hypothetical protein
VPLNLQRVVNLPPIPGIVRSHQSNCARCRASLESMWNLQTRNLALNHCTGETVANSSAGGELEQIQLLLGHRSVETTERYLGSRQRLVQAVNDHLGIEPQDGST